MQPSRRKCFCLEVKLDSPETAKAIATDAAQANDSSNSTVPATPSSSTNSPSAETQSANGTGLKGNDSTANKPDDIPKGSNASKAGSQGGKVPEGGNAPQGGNEPEKANASQRGNVSAEGGLPDGKGLESQGGSVPRAGNVPEGGNMSEEGHVSEEGDGNDRHSPDIARATKEPAALEKPHADEVLEDRLKIRSHIFRVHRAGPNPRGVSPLPYVPSRFDVTLPQLVRECERGCDALLKLSSAKNDPSNDNRKSFQ